MPDFILIAHARKMLKRLCFAPAVSSVGFNGGDARAWLLQIVRNTCYTWLEKNRPMELSGELDEELQPANGRARPAGLNA